MVKSSLTAVYSNLVGGLLTIDMCCCAVYYLDRHLTLENLGVYVSHCEGHISCQLS